MELQSEISHVPIQVISGCLVASIQSDLTTELLRRFQQTLLQRIKSSGVSAIILDVSAVEIMDLDDFEVLRRSMAMASVMGARPILAGLRAGIVASLIALDANVDDIEAAADVDDALQRLQPVGAATAEDTAHSVDVNEAVNEAADEAGTDGPSGDRD